MSDYSILIEKIDQQLQQYGYCRDNDHVIPNALYISYVKNPEMFTVRNLCAIVDIPYNLVSKDSLGRYFDFMRKNILTEYGEAFLWKELEFCMVVLCSPEAFEITKQDEAQLVEAVSFSLNSMLGCCFINKSTLDSYCRSNWGLFFCGDHFKTISSAVDEWCKNKKKELQK